jgi:hypothetical protein
MHLVDALMSSCFDVRDTRIGDVQTSLRQALQERNSPLQRTDMDKDKSGQIDRQKHSLATSNRYGLSLECDLEVRMVEGWAA